MCGHWQYALIGIATVLHDMVQAASAAYRAPFADIWDTLQGSIASHQIRVKWLASEKEYCKNINSWFAK